MERFCEWKIRNISFADILARYRTYWQKSSISEEAEKYIREHFFVNVEEYHVVIGHRADDSYFSFAQDFVSGTISLQKLSEAMHLGRLGEQVVSPEYWSGLTQAALARESGVAVRQIQLFEQRRRDINKTQAIQLLALSKVLGCSMFDLLEI